LELPRAVVYFAKRGIDADRIRGQQQTAYRLLILTGKSFECVREYVAAIPLVRRDLRLCLGGRRGWTDRQGRGGPGKEPAYSFALPRWLRNRAHF